LGPTIARSTLLRHAPDQLLVDIDDADSVLYYKSTIHISNTLGAAEEVGRGQSTDWMGLRPLSKPGRATAAHNTMTGGQKMSAAENKATILRWTAAIQRDDHEVFDAEMHPDARWKIHGDTPIGGEHDMQSIYNVVLPRLFSCFAEPIKFELVGITAEGDRVAAEFTGKAALKNGMKLDNVYHLLFKFQDGKIIHCTEYYDTKHLYDVIFSEKALAQPPSSEHS
jgi:hypothetical protein